MTSIRYDRKQLQLTQEEEQELEQWKPPSLKAGSLIFIVLESYDDYQIQGNLEKSSPKTKCDPYITNEQIGKTISITKKNLTATDYAIPCGVRAKTYFTDTFQVAHENNIIPIDETNIAWDYDKKRYNNINPDQQWLNMTDEHFMVWMRPSGLSNFNKLYGRIYQDLSPGTYTIKIQNNFNSSYYSAEKYLVLTTLSKIGGQNPVLSIGHIVTGAIFILAGIAILIYDSRKNQ